MKAASLFFFSLSAVLAQVPNPTQQQQAPTPSETGRPAPIFRVTVVSRTTKAISRDGTDADCARQCQRE
jgi:hypothetical protein